MRRLGIAVSLGLALAGSSAESQVFRGAPRPARSGISYALTAALAAYDSDVVAYDAAQTSAGGTPLDATRKGLLSTAVSCIKTNGIWSKLDWFSVLAAPNSFAARYNIRNPTLFLTAVNSPTFTTDRGYAGDGVSAYLDSGYSAADVTGQWSRLAASMFIHMNVAQSGAAYMWGTPSGTVVRMTPGPSYSARMNGVASITATTANGLGFHSVSRRANADWSGYRDGVSIVTSTSTTLAPTAENLLLFRNGSAYATGRVAIYGFGGGLTDTDNTNLYSCVSPLLSTIGAL